MIVVNSSVWSDPFRVANTRQVASFIPNGHQLLHSDRDFKPMVEHLGLAEA